MPGMQHYLSETWRIVRGRDALTHWVSVLLHTFGDGAAVLDDVDITTWCDQSFFSHDEVPPPVTCVVCARRDVP